MLHTHTHTVDADEIQFHSACKNAQHHKSDVAKEGAKKTLSKNTENAFFTF
jgi:hypothetical protein